MDVANRTKGWDALDGEGVQPLSGGSRAQNPALIMSVAFIKFTEW